MSLFKKVKKVKESKSKPIILMAVLLLPIVMLWAQPKDIARRHSMNIHGWVGSNNVGLPGVVVSDGFEVTTTDANGIYYLSSHKRHGYVFISMPRNYEVSTVGSIPQFFKPLKADVNTLERADFILTPADNDRHVVLAFADAHLQNDVDDCIYQFNKYVADMNSVIESYRAKGTSAYVLGLGDHTIIDRFVTTTEELADALKGFKAPVFNAIGNHDFLRYGADCWVRSQQWKDVIGPTYFSFNLGEVHYVVLNPFVSYGTFRGLTTKIADYQLEWLKKDLAHVADKSAPLIIATHAPIYSGPNVNNQVRVCIQNDQELLNCLDGFSNVLVLAGHSHMNTRYIVNQWIMEHQIAGIANYSVSPWGVRSLLGNYNPVAGEGSPGGYGVYELDGKNLQWYYKGIGLDRSYQFRTYDRNAIHITAEKYAPNADASLAALAATHAAPYHTVSTDNEVLINVWGYDTDWKIEVTEGAETLPVERIQTKDPLSIIHFEFQAALNRNIRPGGLSITSHFFKVKAKSATSTLNIKVTDRFGNVYEETMTRPKELKMDSK